MIMRNPAGYSTGDHMNNILAVTVTYGNRFHLLRQVIDAALNEGVNKVIVVDNNSEPESREKLKEYHKLNKDRIDVLYLSENLGSAGGFKRGLKRARDDPECEFIWLLDDDNMPCPGSLETLKKFWESQDLEGKEERLALLSYRKDKFDLKTIKSNNQEGVPGKKNSFSGFHVSQIPLYVRTVILRKIRENEATRPRLPPEVTVPMAPYGGLFFNKKLLDVIGYPMEELYLYSDDHEWTYRIICRKGRIVLLTDSIIKDLETSWDIPRKNGTMLSKFSPSNTFRVYYGIRNRSYFEKKYLVTRRYVYNLNRVLFLLLIFFHDLFFFGTLKTFKTVLRAIEDEKKNRLGKRFTD